MIKCIAITNSGIGNLTTGNIYKVTAKELSFPCFIDDSNNDWNLTSYSTFYNCFEVVKRQKFYR